MKKTLPVLVIGILGVMLLLRPEAAAEAVQSGLALCFRTIIPSLFPFFAVVSLLLQLGMADSLQGLCAPFMRPLFHLRGICALPLMTGLLGGYPSGAKTAADLYRQGQLTRQEAEVLLGFCDNCGPAFLLGYVGAGVLGSPRAGMWLFLIHVAAALTVGIVLCRLQPERGPGLLRSNLPVKPVRLPEALTASVSGAVTSTLHICGFVVLFRVMTSIIPVQVPGTALGVLEMATGAANLEPGTAGFVAAAAIVGWGGLSVHCQAMSVTEGLSFRWHWIGKAMQAALSAAMAAGLAGVWGGYLVL